MKRIRCRSRLAQVCLLMTLSYGLGNSLQGAEQEPPKRILFIGNSYTAGIASTLKAFVKASPHRQVHLEFITPGGKNLVFHADQAKTIQRIRKGHWDIVVLQDQSQTPALMPERFATGSKRIHDVISKSGARTAYYQTWGRRDGDARNKELLPTFEKMQDALSKAYASAARRDEAILVPVGEAWRTLRQQDPELGLQLYRNDGSHPSPSGAYLATVCFYVGLFEGDLAEVKYTAGLRRDVIAKLQSAAVQAIKTSSTSPADK